MKKNLGLIIIVAVLLLGLGSFLLINSASSKVSETIIIPTTEPTPTSIPLTREDALTVINKWRSSQGLKPFIQSEFLCSIANVRVDEIKTDFSHNKFHADRFCSQNCTISENIAEGFFNSEDLLQGWLNSPPHKAALMKPYTHTCISTNGNQTVEIFGYY